MIERKKLSLNKASLWWGLVVLLMASCAQVKVRDVDRSLNAINKAISANLPLGFESVSSNGRVFNSKRFVPDRWNEEPKELKPFAYAQITVLGDRRPYDIEVVVIVSHLEHGRRVEKPSKPLARRLATKIDDTLAQRPEDRNVIDDFRVF